MNEARPLFRRERASLYTDGRVPSLQSGYKPDLRAAVPEDQGGGGGPELAAVEAEDHGARPGEHGADGAVGEHGPAKLLHYGEAFRDQGLEGVLEIGPDGVAIPTLEGKDHGRCVRSDLNAFSVDAPEQLRRRN